MVYYYVPINYFAYIRLQDLKYWQVRIIVVPDFHRSITKHLMDNWRDYPDAGIYGTLTVTQQQTVMDGFLKFMENLHHIKRPVMRRCRTGGRERLGSNRITEKPEMVAKSVRGAGLSNESNENSPSSVDPSSLGSSQQDKSPLTKLSCGLDIVAAMRYPSTMLNFFSPPHPSLPHYCFLSVDAVNWVREHIQGVATHFDAMALLKRLCSEKLIRHASGDEKKTVYYGFFIYFIVTGNKDEDTTANCGNYKQQFHEVEMEPIEETDTVQGSMSSVSSATNRKESTAASPSTSANEIKNKTPTIFPDFLKSNLPSPKLPFRSTEACEFRIFFTSNIIYKSHVPGIWANRCVLGHCVGIIRFDMTNPPWWRECHSILLVIIIYHDFLPQPRRGSHGKSVNTHTIVQHTPLSPYT